MDPNYQPVGEKGDRGEQGETGPQGEPGADGADFLVTIPTPTAGMVTDGWAVSGDGNWLEAPSGYDVAGYESFGYRYEGNYLVCKGVVKGNAAPSLETPFTLPAVSVGGVILGLKTDDTSFVEWNYAWWNGGVISVPYATYAATVFFAGWDAVRFALPNPLPVPP